MIIAAAAAVVVVVVVFIIVANTNWNWNEFVSKHSSKKYCQVVEEGCI